MPKETETPDQIDKLARERVSQSYGALTLEDARTVARSQIAADLEAEKAAEKAAKKQAAK